MQIEVLLRIAGVGLLVTRFRQLHWLWFGLGGVLGLFLVYGLFALDPPSLKGLLAAQAYHAGRGGFDPFFAAGAVSDRLLKYLAAQPSIKDTVLIVRDFTKLFITPETYPEYTRRGGTLLMLQRSRLIAVCLNPTSPQGYTLNSAEACQQLSEALGCPVYDVMKCPRP